MSGAMIELAGAAAGEAVRAFLKTAAGMLVLAVVGAILSTKRAVLGGLAGGLQQQRLGRGAAKLLFSPDGPIGRAAERVPLVEAERRLRAAVESVLGEASRRSGLRAWLARAIQQRLLGLIEQVTLARYRADAAEHGGDVDLDKVSEEVGNLADGLLYDKVRGMASRLTALLVLASSGGALLVALGLRLWVR